MELDQGSCVDPACEMRKGAKHHSCALNKQKKLPAWDEPLPPLPLSPRPFNVDIVGVEHSEAADFAQPTAAFMWGEEAGEVVKPQEMAEESGPKRKPSKKSAKMPKLKSKEAPKVPFDAKAYPNRYPAGDTSIDLSAINLALGSDINGNAPMSIDASHGGFPSFIFGPRRDSDTDEVVAEGPFSSYVIKNREAERSRTGAGGSSFVQAEPSYAGPSATIGGVFSPTYGPPVNATDSSDLPTSSTSSDLNKKSSVERVGGEAMQRQTPSANMSQQGNGNGPNGAGAALNGMGVNIPANAGQQMDLNMVFQRVMELSEVLKENRERTQGIVASAEELATRAAASGTKPDLGQTDAEISAARIAELTRQNHELTKVKQILLREQRENTKLIGEYETALGNVVEMVRDFGYNKDMARHAQAREFNSRLQEEKDAHLATRLDRDEWHAKCMRCVEMIRTAYRLRSEEEVLPIRVVAGLQNEVRGYRNALGMDPEAFEEEFGFEVLKYVKNGAGEP